MTDSQTLPVVTPSYDIWVTDRGSDRVVAFDRFGELERVVVPSGSVHGPSCVRVGPDGLLYVAGFGDNEVTRIDASGSAEEFFGDAALLEEPVDIAFRGESLLVLGNDTRNLIAVDRSGEVLREVAHPLAKDSHAFVFGADDLLYIASAAQPSGIGAIQVRDADSGELMRQFGTPDELGNATGLAFSSPEDLWVADYANDRLVRFDSASGAVTAIADPPELSRPVSIVAAPDGWLYVVDDNGVSRVRASGVHAEGEPAMELVIAPQTAELDRPRSITLVPEGFHAATANFDQSP